MSYLVKLFPLLFFQAFVLAVNDRVLLRDVTSITLRRGEYTVGRRSAPIAQLECVGGSAKGAYSPKVVQCYNSGFDGRDVQWKCEAQMGSDFNFGKIEVFCEGYDYPDDPFILVGSCGLRYELDYTASGARKYGTKTPFSKLSGSNTEFLNVVYFLVACFVIYLIYTTLTSSRDGNEGDRTRGGGSGFDHGPGYPPGGPPPPGWRHDPPPTYADSCKYGGNTHGSANAAGTRSNGPGFFTGLGLGALGGYFFGNNSGYDRPYRRRNYFSQYAGDTGFYDNSGGYGFTEGYGDRDQPSTSRESHTATGFGGTSRR